MREGKNLGNTQDLNVSTVERHSVGLVVYSVTSVHTLGKNHSNVSTVERHSVILAVYSHLHTHAGDKPFKNHLCTHNNLNTTDISPVIDIDIT